MIIFLANLAGKDNPVEIADWAQNHASELTQMLGLKENWMPHHNTIRRVFQGILSLKEFEGLMVDYHQTESNADGKVLAIDGKALRGTAIPGQERCKYVLSLYDGQTQQVKAQEVVASKENEIVAAPKALERVKLEGKIITGDVLHTQRALSEQILNAGGDYLWPVKDNQPRLHEDIQRLFASDRPKPGFGRIETDFQQTKQVNYGHGRIETRNLQTSEMLNEYLDWPGVGQVYRLERKFSWIRQGRTYKTSCEVEYVVTNLSRQQATAKKVLKIRR